MADSVVSFRIDGKLKAKVKELADMDRRTLSNFIEALLDREVKSRGNVSLRSLDAKLDILLDVMNNDYSDNNEEEYV